MINLDKYININKETQKFELPLPFWENIKFIFFQKILYFLPIKNKIFIDSEIGSWYWEIINFFLKKEYGVEIFRYKKSFKGIFTHYEANVRVKNFPHVKGHGQSINNYDEAMSKAIGEFLERQLMSEFGARNIKYKELTYFEVHSKTKLIFDYHTFSENQIRNNTKLKIKFGDKTKFSCIKVEDILSKNKVWYPAQSVFVGAKPLYESEGMIYETTSSGCGAGFTECMASLSAIYELIERDGFFCYWLTQAKPELILMELGMVPEYDNLKKILNILGYDIYLLNTTTNFGIPSIVCVCIDNSTKGLCVSSGANLSIKKAITAAVSEMYMCLDLFHDDESLYHYLPQHYKPFSSENIGRTERLNVWNHGKYFDFFQFFISGSEIKYDKLVEKFPLNIEQNNQTEFNFLIDKLTEHGVDKIYKYSAQDKNLNKIGFFVCRFIIPKLFPLYLTEGNALVDSKRLREFSTWKTGDSRFDINIYPHPFP